MAIDVVVVGGSGKAVGNVMKFAEAIAGIIGERAPQFTCAVIDQDDGETGVWSGVPRTQAVTGANGQFQRALGILHPSQECGARLLYSNAELTTEVSEGFHGHPKLAASLVQGRSVPDIANRSTTRTLVLVYSDIGGTGAGIGPVEVKQRLADPNLLYVVAIVFGRYLTSGAQNPTGYAWLQDLRPSYNNQWFFGFYVNAPPLHVGTSTPPADGLNPAPALCSVAAYIWRLAEAEDVGRFLQINSLGNERYRIREVKGYDDRDFGMNGAQQDLITRLYQCGQVNLLNGLIPKGKEFLGKRLRDFVSSGLAKRCWTVFRAESPRGTDPDIEVNLAGGFQETFSSVPEAWAAAEWFHKAVSRGEPTCRNAFLRLVWLFLQGRLFVLPTNWGPGGNDEVYVLSTERLDESAPRFRENFTRTVVGGFSRAFPFWTVPDFLNNLTSIDLGGIPSTPVNFTIRVRNDSRCATAYGNSSQRIEVHGTPCAVQFEAVQALAPGEWPWTIQFDANGWDGLDQCVRRWGFWTRNISVYRVSLTVPPATDGQKYGCEVNGVVLRNRPIIESDGIFVRQQRGTHYYETAVVEGDQTEIVRVLNDTEPTGNPHPQFINERNPFEIRFLNTLIAVSERAGEEQ